MKKIAVLLFVILLFTIPVFSQDNSESAKVIGNSYINPSRLQNKPQGSPYLQKMFASAKIESLNLKAFMRYNVFEDNFEFITSKNDTLILDKIEDFSTIIFSGNNKKYNLSQYTNSKNKLFNGYLICLSEKGNFTLFKKETIAFFEEKLAKTSLESDMPAKYSKSSDFYFFKNNDNGVIEFPDSKKQLIKLFPDKKESIENFLKENKIDFSEESGMIQIINFLATF